MDDSSSRRGTTSENLCQGDEKSMVVMHDVAGPSIDPMRVATDLWLLHKKRTSTTNRGLAPCTCPGSSRRDALVASLNNATSLTTHKADRGGVRDQTSEPSQQRGLHHQGQLSCEPTTPKQLRESGPSPPQKVSLCQEDEAAAGGNCSDRRQKIFEQDCVSDCDAVQTVLEKLQEITLRDSSICGSGKNLGWQRMHSSSERVVGLDAHEMLQTLLLPRTSTTSHAHTEKGQAEVYVLEKQNGLDNFSPIALSLSFLSPARASSPSDPVHPATHKQLDVDDVVVANRPSQAKDKGTMGGLHRSSIWNLGDDVLEQNEPNVGMDLVAHQNITSTMMNGVAPRPLPVKAVYGTAVALTIQPARQTRLYSIAGVSHARKQAG